MSKIEDALKKANDLREISRAGTTPVPDPGAASGDPAAASDLPGVGRRWQYAVGIGLLLLVGCGVYRYAATATTPARQAGVAATPLAAAPHPATAAAPAPQKGLPSVIPLGAPDAAYAAAHPGWQSYQTESAEYRVYREGEAVKAIQVIAPQDKAISDKLFLSFLGEITGKAPFRVLSSEVKDACYIERGALGAVAEVVVYRKSRAGEISAFVVAYL